MGNPDAPPDKPEVQAIRTRKPEVEVPQAPIGCQVVFDFR
jgi:hypothetical protein